MDNRQYFIDIINKFIYGGEYIPPKDIDWFQIRQIAEIHSMLGIVGIVVNRSNINMPVECYEMFDYMVFDGAKRGILIESIFNDVTKALNKAEIPHIIVKGYILRNLYAEKDMRTMGDLDFVLKEEDLEKSKEALLAAGFKLTSVYRGEWSYEKNGMTVELTKSLMDADVGYINYEEYMSSIFDKTVLINEYTYELNNDFHFIYMMLHTMKHFYSEGCGIRMILDLALFVRKYKDSLNWDYINAEFNKLKIDVFAKNIIAVCARMFNIDFDADIDDDLYMEIYDYILEGGAFGFARNKEGIAGNRDRIAKNESVIASLFKRAFPDNNTMKGLIGWYSDKPVILLPVAWVYRWIHSVYLKRGFLFKTLINTGEKDESLKQLELLKRIGLYRK